MEEAVDKNSFIEIENTLQSINANILNIKS